MFEQLGLQSFAKTSGSKGLQVYVPLNMPVTYDDTKPFARAVAELLEKQHPEAGRLTHDEVAAGRKGVHRLEPERRAQDDGLRVLVAREGAPTVSTPVTWDEVADASKRRSAKRLTFEYTDVLDRVERDGDLFAPVLALKQELPQLGERRPICRKLPRDLGSHETDVHTRLSTYLNDHLGGSAGGVELARRLYRSNKDNAIRPSARAIAQQIEEDIASLREIMAASASRRTASSRPAPGRPKRSGG